MSHKKWARSLTGMAAAAAVLVSVLMPYQNPVAAADSPSLTPELRADPTGENPCVGVSVAVMTALGCKGKVINQFIVPSDLVPPIVTTSVYRNCTPGPLQPWTEALSVELSTAVSRSESSTVENSGAKWDTVGGSVSVSKSANYGILGIGGGETKIEVSANYSHTWVDGWSKAWTNTITSTYTLSERKEKKIDAFHWAVGTYTPQYRQVDVLWTWKEPLLAGEDAGARAGLVESIRMPVFLNDWFPAEAGREEAVAGKVAGSVQVEQVPMTPAEIEACLNGGLVAPQVIQATAVPPQSSRYLDEMPSLYSTAPPTAPVLSRLGGTAAVQVPAQLIVARSSSTDVQYETPSHALQLTGDSEIAYWTAGNCSSFTARVGYGVNLQLAGSTTDTFEVWGASIVDGRVEMMSRLSHTPVPAPPDIPLGGRHHFQADVRAEIPANIDVVVLKNVQNGHRNELSSSFPGVIVGEPRLECNRQTKSEALVRSVYVDPIETVTIDLAGTREEQAAQPDRVLHPAEVRYGWDCFNDPRREIKLEEAAKDESSEDSTEDDYNTGVWKLPRGDLYDPHELPWTKVDRSCGDHPLTIAGQVYTSGIGVHSATAGSAGNYSRASVSWVTPPTCSALKFGVGFDDHVSAPNRVQHTVSVHSAMWESSSGRWAHDEQVGTSIGLSGDGASGVEMATITGFGRGFERIRIEIDTEFNGAGHVNIVNPTLTCHVQGNTVATSSIEQATSGLLMDVTQMDWIRASNHHGPAELNMSLGEAAAGDGRPMYAESGPTMSIGGVSDWRAGIGMAPHWNGTEAQIDVRANGRCERFTTWVGIDDEVGQNGSVRFRLLADGQEVASTGVIRGSEGPEFLSADVSGALVLTLAVDNAGDGNAYDHADWAEPQLYCSSSPHHGRTIAASSLAAVYEENHHGPVERNMSLGETPAGDGRPLSIGGVGSWASGFGMAPSVYLGLPAKLTVTVPQGCHAFASWVGIDDEVWNNGSARFWIWPGNRPPLLSDVKRGGEAPQFLRVEVVPGETLTLWVDNGGDGNAYDHANWADAQFYCG